MALNNIPSDSNAHHYGADISFLIFRVVKFCDAKLNPLPVQQKSRKVNFDISLYLDEHHCGGFSNFLSVQQKIRKVNIDISFYSDEQHCDGFSNFLSV